MLKRKGDDGGGGDAKRSCDDKTDPIPRNFKIHEVTLTFKKYTFEQISPTQLLYFPHCQTPAWIMDPPQYDVYMKYRPLACTMELHTPKITLSNLIFLQDDLRVQSNTPTDATAFTQVNYLIQYTPKHQTEFFQMVNVLDDNLMTTTPLTYDIKAIPNMQTQMLPVGELNYSKFDTLGIIPGMINKYAGFIPYAEPRRDKINHSILDTYIAPNSTAFGDFSANLQPEQSKANFTTGLNSALYVRNLGSMHYMKYGDTTEIGVNTNLEGVKLANVPENDFTVTTQKIIEEGSDKTTYTGQFAYPSSNRPFYCRKNYYDPDTDPIIHGKQLGKLSHHFLAMPPITKPDGAILKQRCTFTVDASFSVTFNFLDSIHNTDHDDYFMAQRNAVILRPNIYGKVVKAEPPQPGDGPLCTSGSDPGTTVACDEKPCPYTNNWMEMGCGRFIFENTPGVTINEQWITLLVNEPGDEVFKMETPMDEKIQIGSRNIKAFPQRANELWVQCLRMGKKWAVKVKGEQRPDNYFVHGSIGYTLDGIFTAKDFKRVPYETIWVVFDMDLFRTWRISKGITCIANLSPENTDYKSINTVSTVFYV